MGLLDRIIGRNEYYDDLDDEFNDDFSEVEEEETSSVVSRPNIRPVRRNSRSRVTAMPEDRIANVPVNEADELVIIEPSNIRDAQRVCNDVKLGKTVICNLERIDPVITQRVIDFILGGAYSLNGQVTSVSSMIFAVTPGKTTVKAVHNEPTESKPKINVNAGMLEHPNNF